MRDQRNRRQCDSGLSLFPAQQQHVFGRGAFQHEGGSPTRTRTGTATVLVCPHTLEYFRRNVDALLLIECPLIGSLRHSSPVNVDACLNSATNSLSFIPSLRRSDGIFFPCPLRLPSGQYLARHCPSSSSSPFIGTSTSFTSAVHSCSRRLPVHQHALCRYTVI